MREDEISQSGPASDAGHSINAVIVIAKHIYAFHSDQRAASKATAHFGRTRGEDRSREVLTYIEVNELTLQLVFLLAFAADSHFFVMQELRPSRKTVIANVMRTCKRSHSVAGVSEEWSATVEVNLKVPRNKLLGG
jgi:hypothetical protein